MGRRRSYACTAVGGIQESVIKLVVGIMQWKYRMGHLGTRE